MGAMYVYYIYKDDIEYGVDVFTMDRIDRHTSWHHHLLRSITGIIILVGLVSRLVVLAEPEDIPFFNLSGEFSVYAVVGAVVGHVAVWRKTFTFFYAYLMLATLALFAGIKPIVDWADEGSKCASLESNSAQLAAADACYSGAVNFHTGGSVQASALSSVCAGVIFPSTRSSGVCAAVRWGSSKGRAYRGWMLVHWLVLYTGNLFGIVLALYELLVFGKLEELRIRLINAQTLLFKTICTHKGQEDLAQTQEYKTFQFISNEITRLLRDENVSKQIALENRWSSGLATRDSTGLQYFDDTID